MTKHIGYIISGLKWLFLPALVVSLVLTSVYALCMAIAAGYWWLVLTILVLSISYIIGYDIQSSPY